jgi:hypothetical protein
MAQANLARARVPYFNVFVPQDFGPTGFMKADCFRHDSFSWLFLDLQKGYAPAGGPSRPKAGIDYRVMSRCSVIALPGKQRGRC